jgi:hypothetical protein
MRRLLALAFLGLPCACVPLRSTALHSVDPVVTVHGPAGDELGVSTDYGIVFLGRSVQSGRVEFTTWFGDGPSREEGLVESLGDGLFATDGEILLPSVPLCFETPAPGTQVIVRGRRASGAPFEFIAQVAAAERVTGVLLEPTAELDALTDAERGAGVFLALPGTPLRLLGLLSGRMELAGRRYVTAFGPENLWRLVVRRRNSDRPRRWVYREDLQ